tara:strand:+ start:106 stop:366 length:261 start_codon:yes stop_codon:yes gene_type:complete
MITKTEIIEDLNIPKDRPTMERYTFKKVKITPNELAKEIVWSVLDSAGYWEENGTWNHEDMTERERQQVRDMVQKQVERVSKFLLK